MGLQGSTNRRHSRAASVAEESLPFPRGAAIGSKPDSDSFGHLEWGDYWGLRGEMGLRRTHLRYDHELRSRVDAAREGRIGLLALPDLRRIALDPSKSVGVRKEAMTMVTLRTHQKVTWLRHIRDSPDSPPELRQAAADMILVVRSAKGSSHPAATQTSVGPLRSCGSTRSPFGGAPNTPRAIIACGIPRTRSGRTLHPRPSGPTGLAPSHAQ